MKKKEKNTLIESEDDRVVANMNIEGMPWHSPGKPIFEESKVPFPVMTRRESLRLTFSALAASLLIAIIFFSIFYLFIMFCIHIWFK
ncbi:MAG TPA: hypothetical protein VJ888_06525 [Mobilitalea sp.]|nr:hypothetical protein [Mobilitalea sp.]